MTSLLIGVYIACELIANVTAAKPVALFGLVAPGGVLLYETFADGNAQFGRPSRADFLLQRGELLKVCENLDVVAYEHGYLQTPPRVVQRIAAKRATPVCAHTPDWVRQTL